jgi:hypothetical protein
VSVWFWTLVFFTPSVVLLTIVLYLDWRNNRENGGVAMSVLSEREIIQKLKAAKETLLVIVAEEAEEDGEASSHLRRAIDALQEALLKLQLAR